MQAKNYVAVKQFYAIVPKKLTPQKSVMLKIQKLDSIFLTTLHAVKSILKFPDYMKLPPVLLEL